MIGKMNVMPCELKIANEFIEKLHRHHKKVQGHRFSIAAYKDLKMVGVAICGRPVARNIDPSKTLEVTRLCTDGTKNVCSFLYSAAARIAREMGFHYIQTYILESENGISLKASGWMYKYTTKGDTWNRKSRERIDKAPVCKKKLFYKTLKGEKNV